MPQLTLPQSNPTQFLDTYGKVLGIQQTRQQIQTGQAVQQTAQATAGQAQRENTEYTNVAKFFSNAPNMPEYQNPDGTPNLDKLTVDANKLGPTFGQALIGHYISNIKESANAHAALQAVGAAYAKQMGDGAAALASNPNLTRSDILDYMGKLKETNQDPAFARAIDSTLMGIKDGDSNSLRNQMANLGSVFSGFAQSVPASVETALGSKPGLKGFKGEFTQTGPTVAKESIITMPNGQQIRYNPETNRGEFVGAGNKGGGPATAKSNGGIIYTADNDPQRPDANSSLPKLTAWNNSISAASTHVQTTQQQDDAQGGVGTAINRANVIDRLAKDTRTGPGTPAWQNGLASIGAVFNGHPAQNYHELGMFLDSQAIAFQQSMGIPNTNAGMEKSEHIIGSVANDSNAILAKNDLVTGMRLGNHAYRNGLDVVSNNGVNLSPSAVNKFKNQWASNFDPNVYTYKWKQGEDRAAFVKSLPVAEAKSLAQKARNLDKLERGEILNE